MFMIGTMINWPKEPADIMIPTYRDLLWFLDDLATAPSAIPKKPPPPKPNKNKEPNKSKVLLKKKR